MQWKIEKLFILEVRKHFWRDHKDGRVTWQPSRGTAGLVSVPEWYAAGADIRGRQERRPYLWSQHMKPILAVYSSFALLYTACYDSLEILCGVLTSGSIVLSNCNELLFLPLDKGPIMLKVFPGFSFDQHQLTGQQIFNAREFFGKLHYDLLESYGESARPVLLVEEIIERIDRLRNNLGEVVCTENPDREDWELDQCYYSVSD